MVSLMAEKLELNILCPITYDDLLEGKHYRSVDPKIQKVYIDNLDMFITYIARIPVIAATLTSECVSVYEKEEQAHYDETVSKAYENAPKERKAHISEDKIPMLLALSISSTLLLKARESKLQKDIEADRDPPLISLFKGRNP